MRYHSITCMKFGERFWVRSITLDGWIVQNAPRSAGRSAKLYYDTSVAISQPISMTDLLHTIPDFPIKSYTHLLPSLEKHLITTTDLLTLDALEIAKRAHLPLLDVRRLAAHVVAILQRQLGLTPRGDHDGMEGSLKKLGNEIVGQWSTISTLDDSLDEALGGGIPTGYITEITGERCQLYVLHSSLLAIALWTDSLCLTFQWRR